MEKEGGTPEHLRLRDQWSTMAFYEKFEHSIIYLLTGLIMVIVIMAVWSLMREVG